MIMKRTLVGAGTKLVPRAKMPTPSEQVEAGGEGSIPFPRKALHRRTQFIEATIRRSDHFPEECFHSSLASPNEFYQNALSPRKSPKRQFTERSMQLGIHIHEFNCWDLKVVSCLVFGGHPAHQLPCSINPFRYSSCISQGIACGS